MTSTAVHRRSLLAATGALAAAAAAPASAQSAAAQGAGTQGPAAAPARFATRPLGFDPTAVPGLSEKIIRSHYDNNYAGAVRRLNAIAAQLAALDPAAAPNFELNGLKREELVAWNSMLLHEVYFESLGPQTGPAGALATAIERDFGSHGRWAAEFSSAGKALGGGSGWVILTWSPRDGRLVNTWAADHTMTLAGGAPLLALDMYEHSYHMDYGAAAGAYVDAFMKALSWRGANRRFAQAAMG